MGTLDQRAALEQLIRERREDYSALSRLIGRNAAYIQQFIKRGTPRRLAEEDRRALARYFGVDENTFEATASEADDTKALVAIPRLDVGASAGPGALSQGERVVSNLAFDRRWLKQLCAGRPDDLSIIRVQGDSMMSTLSDGDEIMVDRGDGAGRLRDGIYVMRRDEELIVKRVAVNPATRRITVKSDNPDYPTWPDCDPDDLAIVGRVVWAGRKVA
jgi:phage repressor protein C with HTH and peptisase S24 domain